MKKYDIITIILLGYLAIMAYIGIDTFIALGKYWEYAGIITATLAIIFFLRKTLRKKEELRKKRREENNR
ncbi:MAG: hypothetical protein RR293_03865 [Bacteroidales bacterium]